MRSSKSNLGYAVVTAAALSTGAANAAEKEMLEACTQYFIAANLAVFPGKVSVDVASGEHRPVLSPIQTQYQVAVTTLDRASGDQLAAGVCTVTRSGRVISFKTTSAMSARLTERLAPATVAKVAAE